MVAQSSSSTFRLTIYMSRLEFGPKSYRFFSCWTPGPVLQGSRYSTAPFPYPKPSPLLAPPLPFAVETKERREGKLGHVVVDPHHSSPKTGWGSSPLSVFLHGFFSLFMVVPPCVVQCTEIGYKKEGETEWNCRDCHRHRLLPCCLQGEPLGETCPCRICFPLVLEVFSSCKQRYQSPLDQG